MSVIKNKLKSERGASLSMALLIFLICAVIGSAVLVAGTTASGRISETANYDQRYYAVNSAVRLLQDTIVGKVVKVEKDTSGTHMFLNDTAVNDVSIDKYFVTDAANLLVYSDSAPITDSVQRSFELTATGEIASAVTAEISETINPDGSLVFTVSKEDNGSSSKVYAVRISFALEKEENNVIQGLTESEQTTTLITTLQWKLSNIETIVNPADITTSTYSPPSD